MEGDRERWDAKYAALDAPLEDPDPFLVTALDELGPGDGRSALDLASGRGSAALELARRGWDTSAWDVSPVGLAALAEAADARRVEIETRCIDLLPTGDDATPALEPRFDLVVVLRFLDRPLWARLHELVRPGGHLVAGTYTVDWPGARPPERYRLQRGELAAGLPGVTTLRVEERDGRAALLARRHDRVG